MKKVFAAVASFVLLCCILPVHSCTKQTTVYLDSTLSANRDPAISQQTYLPFLFVGVNTVSTTPVYDGELPDFDKANYIGADSLVFFCSGWDYAVSGGAQGSCIVQLYDKTDNQVIGGSAITINDPSTDAYPPVFHSSINLIDSLPDKPMDLQILVQSSDSTNHAVSSSAFMIIYQK